MSIPEISMFDTTIACYFPLPLDGLAACLSNR